MSVCMSRYLHACPLGYLNKYSAVDEMGDRLVTIDMARKLGAVPLFGGAGSPSNTMWPGPRPTFVPSDILILQPFGHKRHGPKIGGCASLGKELGAHLTQCGQGRGLHGSKCFVFYCHVYFELFFYMYSCMSM